MLAKPETKIMIFASLILILFYIYVDLLYMRPLIHQETGMALVISLVKYGHINLGNGDPWWSAYPGAFDFMPKLRLWFLFLFNSLVPSPHIMAVSGSIIYAVAALWCWYFLARRIKKDSEFKVLFCLWAILPFSYDLWTVGLPQGFKDINFMVIFTPLILGKLYDSIEQDEPHSMLYLGLLSSLYFIFHPTQALLFIQIPFVVLIFYSSRNRIIRNLLIYVMPMVVIIMPYLYLLASKPLSSYVPYEEYLKILNYRFHIIFPDNSLMSNIPVVSGIFKLSRQASNYTLALFGLATFVSYGYLAKKGLSGIKLLFGLIMSLISVLFLGYTTLSLIATLGWYLRIKGFKGRKAERCLAFLPLIILTLSFSMQAFWAIVSSLIKKPLIDNQYLLKLVIIPWIIMGGWFLGEKISLQFRSRVNRYMSLLFCAIFMYFWFWSRDVQSVGFITQYADIIKTAFEAVVCLLCITFVGNSTRIRQFFVKTYGLNTKKVLFSLAAILILSAPLIVKNKLFLNKFFTKAIDLTPYGLQKNTADTFLDLSQAIEKFTADDARFFSAPYAMRLLTRRFVFWTTKDANVYLYGRDWEKIRNWFEYAKSYNWCLDNQDSESLVSLMKETNCRYIALYSKYRLENIKFNKLYDKHGYQLLELK